MRQYFRRALMAVDPVCKMEVDDTEPVARAEYNGNTYVFCSEQCKTTFERNPTEYVKRAS
jgi:YHS domain-containing protein